MFDTNKVKSDITAAVNEFIEHISDIRVGRPREETFNKVKVEAYGTFVPLMSVAKVNVNDATTVFIVPFVKETVKDIMKAFQDNPQGYSVVDDGGRVKITLPAMTEERRKEVAREMYNFLTNDTKVRVKMIRQKANEAIDAQEGISEDVQKRDRETVQKFVDEANKNLDQLAKAKEQEIMKV